MESRDWAPRKRSDGKESIKTHTHKFHFQIFHKRWEACSWLHNPNMPRKKNKKTSAHLQIGCWSLVSSHFSTPSLFSICSCSQQKSFLHTSITGKAKFCLCWTETSQWNNSQPAPTSSSIWQTSLTSEPLATSFVLTSFLFSKKKPNPFLMWLYMEAFFYNTHLHLMTPFWKSESMMNTYNEF